MSIQSPFTKEQYLSTLGLPLSMSAAFTSSEMTELADNPPLQIQGFSSDRWYDFLSLIEIDTTLQANKTAVLNQYFQSLKRALEINAEKTMEKLNVLLQGKVKIVLADIGYKYHSGKGHLANAEYFGVVKNQPGVLVYDANHELIPEFNHIVFLYIHGESFFHSPERYAIENLFSFLNHEGDHAREALEHVKKGIALGSDQGQVVYSSAICGHPKLPSCNEALRRLMTQLKLLQDAINAGYPNSEQKLLLEACNKAAQKFPPNTAFIPTSIQQLESLVKHGLIDFKNNTYILTKPFLLADQLYQSVVIEDILTVPGQFSVMIGSYKIKAAEYVRYNAELMTRQEFAMRSVATGQWFNYSKPQGYQAFPYIEKHVLSGDITELRCWYDKAYPKDVVCDAKMTFPAGVPDDSCLLNFIFAKARNTADVDLYAKHPEGMQRIASELRAYMEQYGLNEIDGEKNKLLQEQQAIAMFSKQCISNGIFGFTQAFINGLTRNEHSSKCISAIGFLISLGITIAYTKDPVSIGTYIGIELLSHFLPQNIKNPVLATAGAVVTTVGFFRAPSVKTIISTGCSFVGSGVGYLSANKIVNYFWDASAQEKPQRQSQHTHKEHHRSKHHNHHR